MTCISPAVSQCHKAVQMSSDLRYIPGKLTNNEGDNGIMFFSEGVGFNYILHLVIITRSYQFIL